SSVLVTVFYGSTVTRLFQGVAATLVGARAFEGGRATALVGVLMHIGVAFGWSTVFFVLLTTSADLRRLVRTRGGVIAAAAIYGPFGWTTMSLAVIPLLTSRPPTINVRWWVQFVGQAPFVGLLIVASLARGADRGNV